MDTRIMTAIGKTIEDIEGIVARLDQVANSYNYDSAKWTYDLYTRQSASSLMKALEDLRRLWNSGESMDAAFDATVAFGQKFANDRSDWRHAADEARVRARIWQVTGTGE